MYLLVNYCLYLSVALDFTKKIISIIISMNVNNNFKTFDKTFKISVNCYGSNKNK